MTEIEIILALLLFQLKHYLADFQWQTGWMVANKGNYGHIAGLAHAGLHGFLSLPVLFFSAAWSPALFVALVLVETILHYHIDWFKASFTARHKIGADDVMYWRFLGLDQAAHHITYVAMLGVLLYAGS